MSSDEQWWAVMSSDEQWWAMMSSDEQWWAMMSNDEQWWAVMSNDEQWWAVMSSDEQWWAMMGNENFKRLPSLSPNFKPSPIHTQRPGWSAILTWERASCKALGNHPRYQPALSTNNPFPTGWPSPKIVDYQLPEGRDPLDAEELPRFCACNQYQSACSIAIARILGLTSRFLGRWSLENGSFIVQKKRLMSQHKWVPSGKLT